MQHYRACKELNKLDLIRTAGTELYGRVSPIPTVMKSKTKLIEQDM